MKIMNSIWEDSINKFIDFATKEQVKMILVGGGAVNFEIVINLHENNE